jgi:membrane protein
LIASAGFEVFIGGKAFLPLMTMTAVTSSWARTARKLTSLAGLLKPALWQWFNHNAFEMAAALAYYTLVSLAPLIIILIAIVGPFFGTAATENYIVEAIAEIAGEESARAVQAIVYNANQHGSGALASAIGVALLLIGAGAVVGQLQQSLNVIFGVTPKPEIDWWALIRARSFSYAMLLAIGFLLLVSLIVTTVLSAISKYFGDLLPSLAAIWPVVDLVSSFALVTLLFAMIYKILPDVHIAWRDAVIGAALTSLLFSVGKLMIGLYLGRSTVAAAYGAAGSVVTIMLWVYYSALIVFYGAEITQLYATQAGSGVDANELADKTEPAKSKP